MNILQRWKQTTIANKGLVFSSVLMAFGTLFYAGAAFIQVRIMKRSAADVSLQTDKLIKAAQSQACAASSFAASASNINLGIGTAVRKLNLQAEELQASVQQATRLATATETANDNVINSDRPWMGAFFSIDGFASNQTPTYSVGFINSGKRPARVILSQTLAIPLDQGDDPVYVPYDTTPSVSVVVPGQSISSVWKETDPARSPIPEGLMKMFDSGVVPFRIYAKIEYRDVRTSAAYWTHVCWRYTPKQLAANNGFSNCAEYNDAK